MPTEAIAWGPIHTYKHTYTHSNTLTHTQTYTSHTYGQRMLNFNYQKIVFMCDLLQSVGCAKLLLFFTLLLL